MTEKRQPWAKWYWGDWRKDARLRRCSYAARGLWADMLSLMGGECDRFGYLVMEDQALGASDLAGLLGGAERDVQRLLDELQGKRVFSRTGDTDLPDDIKALVATDLPVGTLFSRRMLRDKAKEASDRENGRKGGNPRVKADIYKEGEGGKPPDRTRGLTQGDKAQSQKPEARTSSLRSDGSEPQTASEPESPAFIGLETNRQGEQFIITSKHVADFKELYPAVDVEQQLRSMRGWLIGNPGKRKTRNGMLRFVNGWLSKEQDKGHANGTSHSNNGKNGKSSSHQNHLEGLALLVDEDDRRTADVSERGSAPLAIGSDGRGAGRPHDSH
jgi:hypothetical protein